MRTNKTTRRVLCLYLCLMMVISTISPVFADVDPPVGEGQEIPITEPASEPPVDQGAASEEVITEPVADPTEAETPRTENTEPQIEEPEVLPNVETTTPSFVNPEIMEPIIPEPVEETSSFYQFGAVEKALEENAQFMPNTGQMDESVSWYGNFGAGTVFVENNGTLTYLLMESGKEETDSIKPELTEETGLVSEESEPVESQKGWVLKENFVGAEEKAVVSGKSRGSGKFNFLLGSDKKKHQKGIGGYKELSVTKLYPKIDLLLSHKGETIEKTFQLNPGADPSAIKIQMDGAQNISVDSKGNLVVNTELGNVLFSAPIAWQGKGGADPVEVKYWTDGIQYGFSLGAYDEKKSLFIDPEIVSTYFGGNTTYTNINDLAVDSNGDLYVTGSCYQDSFPTTAGAYDRTFNGYHDVIVVKLDKDLSRIEASTFLGGSGFARDVGKEILIDESGRIYLGIETESSTFPIVGDTYDSSHNGNTDVVIAIMNENLAVLESSTYIGGGSIDYITDMQMRQNGDIVFTGKALSNAIKFPTTPGCYDSVQNGTDAYVSIISSDLSELAASTLLGGALYEDYAYDLALASSGDIYIAGYTACSTFPVTSGAYDKTFNGGLTDAFVTCFNSTLTSIKYSTFLGGYSGNSFEVAGSLEIFADGSIAVAGATEASNFPTTEQAFSMQANGGQDAFLSVLSYNLGSLKHSTYIGGSGDDGINDITVDDSGILYVIGGTNSTNFPVTLDALDRTLSGTDGLIMKFDSNLADLRYSTFLGGSGGDSAVDILLTDEGTLYISGGTGSRNFPVTNGALQTINYSAAISFLLKTPRDLTGLAAADWVRLEGIQPLGLNAGYGGYTIEKPVLKLTGARSLDFRIGYNSILLNEGPLGPGWTHNFETSLIEADSGNVEVRWNQNRISRFSSLGDGAFLSSLLYNPYEHLVKEADGSFTLTDRGGEVYRFDNAGVLTEQKNKISQALSFAYDGSGRLQTISEAVSGRELTLSYNAAGLLESVTDSLSRQAAFAYDETNRLTTYTDAAGYETHYSYNEAGQILTVTNDDGEVLKEYTYDEDGRVVDIEDNLDDSNSTTVAYEEDPRTNTVTATLTDRNNKSTVAVYSAFYDLKKATDPLNDAVMFAYDKKGNVTSATDAEGHTTHFTWDADGNMTRAYDDEGHDTQFAYDEHHNILSVENALNKLSLFTYDSNNNLTEYEDALNNVTAYVYTSDSLLTGVTSPRGGVTSLSNQSGQPLTITPSGGSAVTLAYDDAGRLTAITDGAGKTTSYSYDVLDRLLSVTDPLDHTTSYSYDCDGNLLTVTDPRNNTTRYVYDSNDRLIRITDALNHSTDFGYDAAGQLISKTDALDHSTQYAYDDKGRLISQTDPLSHVTSYGYDGVGRLTLKKDALNNPVFSGTYDEIGNLLTTTDALNHTTQNTYDLLGRLTSVEDPLSRITGYGYDDVDRLIRGTDAQLGQSTLGYDADGNRNTITDQNSQQTGFAFDLVGRLTSITSAAGSTKAYQYNPRELVSQITNGRQQAADITYDDAGRITSITDPAGTISYTYDNAGNILTVSDSSGTLTRQYDALGRITQYTDGTNTIGYGYDEVGRLTTLTYPGGRSVTYSYDAANRLTSVTDWASRQTQYGYDAADRLTTITRPNGSHQTNTYDAKGQLTVAEDRDSQNALISRYEYTYDDVGNITTETSTSGQGHVETNTYSAIDRITAQAVTENGTPTEQYGYTYDAGGNLLTASNNGVPTTFTNGNANRLATVNGQAVAYDADGNITTAPLNGTPETFTFDARNRLASVGSTTYAYNAENQRIGITENGVSTSYVINPNAALYQNLIKTTGGVSTYYVYGLGLIGEETGTDYTTYHYDLRGSTVALTNSTGLVTDTYSYAPYGELLDHTGTSDVDYLYNGRDGVITDDNGLYQMRARYYSPELRRFLSEDEYVGKYDDILNINLYAYCEGNPVGFVDPSGQEAGSLRDNLNPYDPSEEACVFWANTLLVDDVNTLMNPNASMLDKALAGGSFVPGLKGLKVASKIDKPVIKINLQLFASKSGSNATGQLHHLLSNKTMNTLNQHPILKGVFERNDAKFLYRAADAEAHKGYQAWHRAVDSEVVEWLERNPNATSGQFKSLLNDIYSRPEIKKLIPGVKID